MIQIQQGALGPLEKDGFAFLNGCVQKFGRICDIGQELVGIGLALFKNGFGVDRLGVIKGREDFILVLDDRLQFGFELPQVPEISHPDGMVSADFVGIARTDASNRGADLVLAERLLTQLVLHFMIIQNDVSVFANQKSFIEGDIFLSEFFDSVEQNLGINDDTVCDDAHRVRTHGAAGQKM